MLIALLITNIVLVGMVVHTKKQTKIIAKEIHEVGLNLAYIQSNTVELGTNLNEVKTSLEGKLEKDKEEMKNFSVKLTEVIANQISESINESKDFIGNQFQENKAGIISSLKEEISRFTHVLTCTPLKIIDVFKK